MFNAKRRVLPILSGILLLCFIGYSLGQTVLQGDTAEAIDSYMVGLADRGYAGAVLIAQDGEVVLSKGYGLAIREESIPYTPETVASTGSITKQFTGAAILKLEEQGKLKVTDPISKYFDNVPEDKQAITIHHLLTHSAGFPGGIGDDFEAILRDDYVAKAFNRALLFTPGETYEYSNAGYSILTAIVEKLTGQSYESYVREYLFEPAGMMKTGYILPDWQEDELAHGYLEDGEDWGSLLDQPFGEDGPYWNLRGNGGILSTIEDMYKWHLALEVDGILSETSKEKLYTPFVDEGGGESFYGYGWVVMDSPMSEGTLITHNGGNGIFHADFLRFVDDDVVIYLNSSAGQPDATQVSWTLARMIFEPDYTPTLPWKEAKVLSLEELKDIEIGQHAIAFVGVLADDGEDSIRSFYENHLSSYIAQQVSYQVVKETFMEERNFIGETTIVAASQLAENQLEVKLEDKEGKMWTASFFFDEKAPYGLTEFDMRDVEIPLWDEPKDLSLEELEASAMGQRILAYLDMTAGEGEDSIQDFLIENVAPPTDEVMSLGEAIEEYSRDRAVIGAGKLVSAKQLADNVLEVVVETAFGEPLNLTFAFEGLEPFRIVGIGMED